MKAIYLVRVATGQVSKLIDMPYYPMASTSTWSPDGKHLAYDVRGESDWILTTSIDGSPTITLTQGTWPAWSPTGNEIAFVRSGKIWLYHLSDKAEEILIDDPVGAGAPAWSPDGRQLLFVSRRDGNEEVYRINRDGSGLVRLTNDPAGDGFPAWRPAPK
jgi:TolB protein